MPPDAEELRRRTEEGKKNNELRELIESINYEIVEQTTFGNSSTTYKLGQKKAEFADAVLEYFSETDCKIKYDEVTTVLHISWEAT